MAPPSPAGLTGVAGVPSPAERPWTGHPLFSLENVYRAYLACRKRKRKSGNTIAFETRLEDELVALHEELESGSYTPRPFVAFLVSKPKRREIFAADFRDRVVHHVLSGHLEPRWERRFIHDSYACRKGKGTHAAVERLRTFTRQATANCTRRAWYLQLDVKGFFVSIDRERLWQRLARHEHDPAVLWLVRTILFQDPAAGCSFRRSRPEEFLKLPAHKSLFRARPGCGLPIGNLTSQLFANIVLDGLDQLVKHDLKVPRYIRYCDDMVLVSDSPEELARWEEKIGAFLGDSLGLSLNARRKLAPVSEGIDFLGYVVRPDYLLVRRRVVGALKDRLARVAPELAGTTGRRARRRDLVAVQQWLASYRAHFARASSHRLERSIRRRHPWLDQLSSFPPRWVPRSGIGPSGLAAAGAGC